ncbi:MAG: DNA (cytosine-5-)-methyltransferase [Peptostreptococcaceae bacterium]|nr:DNA (cytosine-5-)-methyltransferase [Peptostreptococcaceae bacterium]
MEKTVCELFAGVGGFRLGLENSSKEWKTVWFNQWEPNKGIQWAHGCYVHNFGDVVIEDNSINSNTDIEVVNKKNIPKHNLLVGGFPCQDYSVARGLKNEKGIHGKKGVLWWSIRDVLIAKKPPFVLLENVDRLLKSPSKQRGRDFGIILACLNDLNYSVEWRVVNAAKYGAAQRRRRVFIFAYKNNTKYAKNIKKVKREAIIGTEGFFAQTFPIENIESELTPTQIEFKNIEKVSDDFEFNFQNAGYCERGNIYTVKVKEIEEAPITLDEILQNRKKYNRKYYKIDESYFVPIDKLYYNLDKRNHYDEETDGDYESIRSTWQYIKGGKKKHRISKTGYKYEFSEGPVPFPEPLNKPSRTMLTSESTFNRSTHVVMDPVKHRIRKITPIEAERLQGFNDCWTKLCDFTIKGQVETKEMPERMRYFCMGNALVVPMVTRMAKTIEQIMDDVDR